MGWFSRNKTSKASFSDPPNVYVSQQQQQQQQATPAPYDDARLAVAAAAPPVGYLAAPQPVIVNQHYYLGGRPSSSSALGRFTGSVADLAREANPLPQLYDDGLSAWHGYSTQLLNCTAAMYDQAAGRFGHVMTLIDGERLVGNECGLFDLHVDHPSSGSVSSPRRHDKESKSARSSKKSSSKDRPKGQAAATVASSSSSSSNYFSKVELYANSKLPANLPPLTL